MLLDNLNVDIYEFKKQSKTDRDERTEAQRRLGVAGEGIRNAAMNRQSLMDTTAI